MFIIQDFIFNVMMEKVRSRLKFIEKKLISIYDSAPDSHSVKVSSATNFIVARDPTRDKALKITKKNSQFKDKEKKEKDEKGSNKKEDTDFHPKKR